jgi:hypothetical protein
MSESDMTHLSKRLAKLEAAVAANSPWSVSSAEVDKVALGLLSAADRDLVQQARARGNVTSLEESHAAVWDSWDAALGEAIRRTGYPVRFHAIDWEM